MENSLTNKKVRLEPIIREGWLPKGHDGEFLFSGAFIELEVKKDPLSRQMIDPLRDVTDKTKQKILDAYALDSMKDLAILKKENNFWKDEARVFRSDKHGFVFDLSNPVDFVMYRIVCTYIGTLIVESYEERKDRLNARFVLVDDDVKVDNSALSEKDKMRAYTKFGSIQNNENDMYDFLLVYHYKFKKKEYFPHYSWTQEKFIDIIGAIIQKDIKGFLSVMDDTNYKFRVLIYSALSLGLMEIVDKYKFQLKDTDRPIGSIEETVLFLADAKNNETYIKLKAQVEDKLRKAKV